MTSPTQSKWKLSRQSKNGVGKIINKPVCCQRKLKPQVINLAASRLRFQQAAQHPRIFFMNLHTLRQQVTSGLVITLFRNR